MNCKQVKIGSVEEDGFKEWVGVLCFRTNAYVGDCAQLLRNYSVTFILYSSSIKSRRTEFQILRHFSFAPDYRGFITGIFLTSRCNVSYYHWLTWRGGTNII